MSFATANDKIATATEDADDTGYILGEVVENEDPDGIGRIKVKVPNLYDPDQGEVPWVGPHKTSLFGIGPTWGTYGSPAIGSKVKVRLQNGDVHYALAEADELIKAHANPKFKSPKTWGFKDPSGNELFVDMDAQDWQFTHSSGLTLKYDKNGDLKLHVPKDYTSDIQGNETETVTGNAAKTVQGTLNLTVTGNITVHTDGSATVSAGGSVTITGSSVNIN